MEQWKLRQKPDLLHLEKLEENYSLLNAYCFLTISWGSEENISLHFQVLLYSPKSVNGGYCSENMDSDLNWISYSITA